MILASVNCVSLKSNREMEVYFVFTLSILFKLFARLHITRGIRIIQKQMMHKMIISVTMTSDGRGVSFECVYIDS